MCRKPSYETLESRIEELEKKEAEYERMKWALTDSEKRFLRLHEISSGAIGIHDFGVLVEVNKATTDLTGYTYEELIGMNGLELLAPEYRDLAKKKMASGDERPYDAVGLRKDGSTYPLEVQGKSIPYSGRILRVTEFRDITIRKQYEEELEQRKNELSSIIRTTPDIIYRLDADGKITFISDAVEKYGYTPDELVGRMILDFVHPEDKEKAFQRINERRTGNRRTKRLEIRLFAKDRRIIDFQIASKGIEDDRYFVVEAEGIYHSSPDQTDTFLGTQGIARDITEQKWAEKERRELEQQLQKTQKMQALATLTGGIAHDFNNILTAIMGYTELSIDAAPPETPLHNNMQQILRAGNRAKDLISQILTFSRQAPEAQKPVEVVPIIKEVIKFLRSTLPTTIEIRQEIEIDTGVVHADPTQVHQILMNLCTNAAHAMNDRGGVMEISLSNRMIKENDTAFNRVVIPGRYLHLCVSDTGHGIPPDKIDRIFDPYFTTKDKSEGTGLGLAVVHSIVERYGGAVTVESEIGEGSKFHIYFPALDKEVIKTAEFKENLATGHERILFVDDEQIIVEMGVRMLENLGYTVTAKTNSREAVIIFENNPEEFDLVITDMTMPNLRGDQLAKELLRIRPEVPIIISTGFSEMMDEKKAEEMGIASLIYKPFLRTDIAKAIREALDNRC